MDKVAWCSQFVFKDVWFDVSISLPQKERCHSCSNSISNGKPHQTGTRCKYSFCYAQSLKASKYTGDDWSEFLHQVGHGFLCVTLKLSSLI